jgi:hypothetical protein
MVNIMLCFLYHWEGSGTHCMGDWMGLRACLNGMENVVSLGFNFWTVQPVTSHYTNDTIPSVLSYMLNEINVFTVVQ